ncbi:hypothetical protein BH24ACI2_BH24ACI2_13150 [soil metagenome]
MKYFGLAHILYLVDLYVKSVLDLMLDKVFI